MTKIRQRTRQRHPSRRLYAISWLASALFGFGPFPAGAAPLMSALTKDVIPFIPLASDS